MKRTVIFLLAVFYLSVTMLWAMEMEDEEDWVPGKDKKGVKSYSRTVKGSPIKEYRAVADLDFPIEVLFEVLIDVPNFPKWMPDCKEAEILKEFHKGLERGNYYVHIVFNAVWPAQDRDLIIESSPRTDWERGVSVIKLSKLENFPLPAKKGTVRIQEFVSEFKLEYLSREKTAVTFTTYVDVGGAVPPALAAIQTADVPYGTLVGLQKMAGDPKYRKAAIRDYF